MTDRNTYEMLRLGRMRFENAIPSPLEQQYTVMFMTDDNQDGVVQVYIGTKQATGKFLSTMLIYRVTRSDSRHTC